MDLGAVVMGVAAGAERPSAATEWGRDAVFGRSA